MLSPVIKDLLYRAKALLLSIPAVAAVNRVHKAHQLRTGLQRLEARYAKQTLEEGLTYQEEELVAEFRRHVVVARPNVYPKKAGELRIFWVGANRDQDESGFLQALRRLATVIEFRNWKGSYGQWYWDEQGHVRVYDPAIVALNDQSLVAQIELALQEGPIDLLMGQMWANYISKEALAKVRSYGIPVINISMDDRLPDNWGSKSGTRLGAVGLSAVTDLVLTTSSETCPWYAVEGCPAIFWPLASDPDVFSPGLNAVRDIDVLFIGNKYGIRESIVRELNQRGVPVECYGAGWPNGPSTAEQSAALFKRAKIILGVGTVGYCKDVFTLKLRDFDAPMSGALYLTHRCADLARLYQEGIEIECYTTPEEGARKIQYYLAHPDEMAGIGNAGHAKAISRDTWLVRLHVTFARLGLLETTSADFPSLN
jgi:spore maturation protein CgeB